MNSLKIFFRKIVVLAIVLFHASAIMAQIYQIGDVFEFPDGSKGVICYVNPDNPVEGWAVALNDVGWVSKTNNQSFYLLDEGAGIPSEIENHPYEYIARYGIDDWSYEGKKNTRALLESGNSPAAEAVDFYNGWYIPDAIQLRHVFGLIPFIESSIVDAGGDIEGLRWMYAYNNAETGHDYWTSTRTGNNFLVIRGSQYFYNPRNPADHSNPALSKVRIRAVRDFGTDAYAYWVDNPKSASMKVSPDVNTSYHAYVIFNSDTLHVNSSAIVHETYDKDTCYETVCASPDPYTSLVNPNFVNLDISTPQAEEYTHRVTLQTVHGCDSIITLKLKVNPVYEFVHDTAIKVSEVPYTWRGRQFYEAGDYYDSLLTTCCGCDSVYVLHLALTGIVTYGDTTALSCTAFTWHDSTYTVTPADNPTYTMVGANMYGCDSIVTLYLTILPHYWVEKKDTVCSNGFPYTTEDTTFLAGTVTDNYVVHRTTVQGCDSLISVELYVIPPIASEATLTCPPDTSIVLAYGACDTTLVDIGNPVYYHSPALDGVSYTISNDAPAGSTFAVGSTIVTWTVEDECGMTLDCTQKVNVVYPPCGTPADSVADYDGFRYSSVRIGCQCWTGENARSTHYADGTPVANYSYYNNLDSLEGIYGKMYSWYSAVRVSEGDNSAVPADSMGYFGPYVQGICPEGWALPTVDEYMIMLAAAGGTAEQIKSASSLYWMSGYEGTSPNSGFNARGAGRYDAVYGHYKDLMLYTNFWTVNDGDSPISAISVYVPYICGNLEADLSIKNMGFSVRCLRKR